MELVDLSTEEAGQGIQLNIFRPKEEIPEVGNRDIVLLYNAKVSKGLFLAVQAKVVSPRYSRQGTDFFFQQIQRWGMGTRSLITHFSTSIAVYSASKIPAWPKSAIAALGPSLKPRTRNPDETEHEYVSYLYGAVGKEICHDDDEFQAKAASSLNVRDKFSLLKDVQEGQFCDLIAHVARDPFNAGGRATLYVSDYTENKFFFHHTYEGIHDLPSAEGDADSFGCTSSSLSSKKEWQGPYGKRIIQITCFEPHASFVVESVKAQQWLLLKNVQIKYGQNGMNLEGYLREDQGAAGIRLSVSILSTEEDRDRIDPRFKDAVRRCRDYLKQFKTEVKKLEQATGKGTKRKAQDESSRDDKSGKEDMPKNAKGRRSRKRLEARQKEEDELSRDQAGLGLNPQVTCEMHQSSVSTISQMLEPAFHDTTIHGQCLKLPLPFTCTKYRACVRVVDFYPRKLEDFAASYRVSQFDMLSDNGSDSEDEVYEEAQEAWEWRFALQLQDAQAPRQKGAAEPSTMWVVVGNADAQYLTGLDASDLRNDPENLEKLRSRLFTLWGDLEEHKVKALLLEEQARRRKPGGRPVDSEDEGDADAKQTGKLVSNIPFTCCIKQYGVQVPEEDPTLADADRDERWERVYGLFGTKVA